MACGSELGLAMQASKTLRAQGLRVRVVSIPSTTVFDQQTADYKSSVLPPGIPRVAVEAGVTDFWWKYQPAAVLGLDRFGESAPAAELFRHAGITADALVDTVHAILAS
jgi:transketolase